MHDIDLIYQEVLQAGNDLKYLNTIHKNLDKDLFNDILAPIYFALQQDLYISLGKVLDRGSDAISIYKIIKENDNSELLLKRRLKRYDKMISSIRERRNKIFAHNLPVNPQDVFNENQVSNIEELLKTIVEIIVDIDQNKTKAYYTSNANRFERYMKYIRERLEESSYEGRLT